MRETLLRAQLAATRLLSEYSERSLAVPECLREIALGMNVESQAIEANAGIGIIGTENALAYLHRPLEKVPSPVKRAECRMTI
jgi:hypothetical protein